METAPEYYNTPSQLLDPLEIQWSHTAIKPLPWSVGPPIWRYHYGALDAAYPAVELCTVDVVVHDDTTVDIEYVATLPQVQQHGVGTMAVRAALKHLHEQRFRYVTTESVSVPGLHCLRNAIPEDSIHFTSFNDPELGILPVRFDQALISAKRAYKENSQGIHNFPGFGVRLDLHELPTHGWPTAKPSLRKRTSEY